MNSKELDKFILRLPDGMRDAIRDAAAKNGRSMNTEIVWRLQQSLAGNTRPLLSLETVAVAAAHYGFRLTPAHDDQEDAA